ncbi:hypothetical protein JOQ06_005472, partial [Pogonophryne albipinna]
TSFSLPLRFLWPPKASSSRQDVGLLRDWDDGGGGGGGLEEKGGFMGAQSFSKYLPFPLYCGRLMAFDVGGLEVQGVGMEDGRSVWIGRPSLGPLRGPVVLGQPLLPSSAVLVTRRGKGRNRE